MGAKILIVGAGVAGLAAAIFLSRDGHDVTVLERAEEHVADETEFGSDKETDEDHVLGVFANGLHLLTRVGAQTDNLKPVVVRSSSFYTGTGHLIMREFGVDSTVSREDKVPTVLATRQNLYKELLRLVKEQKSITIHYNKRVSKIDVAAAKVNTEDSQTYQGDLLIGADGINSSVRTAIQEAEKKPAVEIKTTGQRAWWGFLSKEDYERILPDHADPKHIGFGIVKPTRKGYDTWKPIDEENDFRSFYILPQQNRVQLTVIGPEHDEDATFGKRSTIHQVDAKQLLEDYADYGDVANNLLKAVKSWNLWRLRDVDPFEEWASGKTVLVGDAAHAVQPHAGQGANQGIEDSEALAVLLRGWSGSADEVSERVGQYLQLRQPRAQLYQIASRHFGGSLKGKEKEVLGGPLDMDYANFYRITAVWEGAEHAIKTNWKQEFPKGYEQFVNLKVAQSA